MELLEEKTERMGNMEAYDANKVAMIKKHLEYYNGKEKPLYYDIAVDDMKVVEKTNDPKEFDGYKEFIEGADELIITIYNRSPKSPKVSKKTIFSIKDAPLKTSSQALSGFELEGIINRKVDEKVDAKVTMERERWDNGLTRDKLEAKIKELAERDATIVKLNEENQLLRSKKAKSDLNFIDIGGILLEGAIRRNPHIIEKMPGGEALAGLIRQDNESKDAYERENNEESEVSFSKKSDGAKLTEQEEKYISILRMMEQEFDAAELEAVMGIIYHLNKNTADIPTVAELLEIKTKK